MRPPTPTLTDRVKLLNVTLKHRAAEAPPNPLNSTVPGSDIAIPARTVGQTRKGGSVATVWFRATHPPTHEGVAAQLAWSLLEHNTTGIPRLIASLRANCNPLTSSFEAVAIRLPSIIDRKLGTPMPSSTASTVIVTINSMRVKPRCSVIFGRYWSDKSYVTRRNCRALNTPGHINKKSRSQFSSNIYTRRGLLEGGIPLAN
jgi:hypothetical protein